MLSNFREFINLRRPRRYSNLRVYTSYYSRVRMCACVCVHRGRNLIFRLCLAKNLWRSLGTAVIYKDKLNRVLSAINNGVRVKWSEEWVERLVGRTSARTRGCDGRPVHAYLSSAEVRRAADRSFRESPPPPPRYPLNSRRPSTRPSLRTRFSAK